MGNFIAGIAISTGAVLGGYGAQEAIAYEKKAVAECAEFLGDTPTDIELLPIECMPYGFETTDVVEQGELVHRTYHLSAKDDFISRQNEELNPVIKYIALTLAGALIFSVVSLVLPSDD